MEVKLTKLKDVIFYDGDGKSNFMGIKVEKHRDINGLEYELKADEMEYYLLTSIEGVGDSFESTGVYVSERKIWEMLMEQYISEIENGGIYSHGYPESRLIPNSHKEDCEDSFTDSIIEVFSEKIEEVLNCYF